MVIRASKTEKRSDKLTKQIGKHLGEINNVKRELEENPALSPDTITLLPALNAIAIVFEDLLLRLPKESTEAMVAAAELLKSMKLSLETLRTILSLLKYFFGDNNPIIKEFISPDNWRGFGHTPGSRLISHKLVNRTFNEQRSDFPEYMVKDFEAAEVAGTDLEEKNISFLKEDREARKIIEEAIDAISEYKKLRRKIRNWLKSELDDPQDVYKYIPKRKFRKKSGS